jgi:hypothetical protein
VSNVRTAAAGVELWLGVALLLLLADPPTGAAQGLWPAPARVGEWRSDTPSPSVRGVVRAGSTVYALDGDAVHVLDVSDPARPTRRARVDLGARPFSMAVAAGALLVLQQSGLRIFDVADPGQPREVGSYPSPIGDCQGSAAASMAVAGGDLGAAGRSSSRRSL